MSPYPNLSDEQLVERLRSMASAREAELVEVEEAEEWSVSFMRYGAPGDPEPERGVSLLRAEGPELRTAREALLYMAENP